MLSGKTLKTLTTECLHKIPVTNPYTGIQSLVPCGTCPACRLKTAFKNELQCQATQTLFKYTYFITLTYSSDNCPRYKIVSEELIPNSDKVLCRCRYVPRFLSSFSLKSSLSDNYPIRRLTGMSPAMSSVFEFIDRREYVDNYKKQASLYLNNKRQYLKDSFGFLSYNDLSLFYKRLRKNIFNLSGTYEKIHTYSIGEYSPKHFRPHFHIILHTDSKLIAENFGNLISRSWKFGRISYSKVRSNAINYVAGYLNATYYTPRHLVVNKHIRPRGRFSNGYRKLFFKDEITAAIQGDYTKLLDAKRFTNNGRLWAVYPSKQVLDTIFFPVLPIRPETGSAVSQTIYALSKFVHSFDKGKSVTENLYAAAALYLKSYGSSHKTLDPGLHSIFYRLSITDSIGTVTEKQLVEKMYRLILQTKKILDIYGINLFEPKDLIKKELLFFRIIQNSINFYLLYERQNQKNYYRRIMDLESHLVQDFWKQTPESLKHFTDSPDGRLLLSYQKKALLSRIKHRELNDLNIQFVYS